MEPLKQNLPIDDRIFVSLLEDSGFKAVMADKGDDQKAFCSSPSGLLNPRRLASAAPIRGISHLWCDPFVTF